MCGICGFTWQDKSLIRKMAEVISHRGPDDYGVYTDKHISLGHRRLSIIDTSKKGHQPMFNENKKIIVIFNGEIWNYKYLKEILEKKGHKFKSESDTEVIIHGYEEFGEEICSKLDGMFAFALWDVKKNKLVLARDKIGKRPLYYHIKNNKLIFASEIKAILEHKITLEINESCLSDYLTLRYSPNSLTMFKYISKVPPASYIVFEKNKIKTTRYYSLPDFNNSFRTANLTEADSIISKSIEKRLMSDVPIGVFLSGGLDSSAIVAYMSKFTKKINTFSVGFDSKVDETKYSRIIAEKYNTNHKEIKLSSDILKYLPEVVWHFDEPLADPAALPTYLLCREVSKHVKVALSGEGGDEVFGGYDSFNYIKEIELISKIPYFLRKNLLGPTLRLFSKLYAYPRKHFFLAISETLEERDAKSSFKKMLYFPFNSIEKARLFNKSISEDKFDSLLKKDSSLETIAQKYYFTEWLPNDLLMKADKMGMASSIEIRTPFLDNDLIAYFSSLKYSERHKRNVFRKIVSKYLPSSIMSKKKQGFTLPLSEWFSNPKTFSRIVPFFEKLKSRNIFNPEEIDTLISNPTKYKNEHKLWVLLNFEIWYELFIEKINYNKIIL